MRTRKLLPLSIVALLALLLGVQQAIAQDQAAVQPNRLSPSAPLGTGFTYQGQLKDSAGSPISGSCDFRFILYNAEAGGSQVRLTQEKTAVGVASGYFTVSLDFGSTAFAGEARWLEVAVKCSGEAVYTTLSPRQSLAPAPYASYALASDTANTANTANSALSAVNADNALNADSAASAPWGGLTGVPAGFADNLDNDTTYTAGYGLTLAGTKFSVSFAGSGSANTASRSDHDHSGVYSLVGHTHWGESWSGSGTGLTLSGGTTGLMGSGDIYGVSGQSDAISGVGVYGYVSNTESFTFGVYGESDSPFGSGVNGTAGSSSGTTHGVSGYSESTSGIGVYGFASNAYGYTYGVYGQTASTDGTAVYAYASASTGNTTGVSAYINSETGKAVSGWADKDGSYTAVGVYGRSDANNGFGAVGHNYYGGVGVGAWSFSGDLIRAYDGDYPSGALRFYIDQNGNVYADGGYGSFLTSNLDGANHVLASIQSTEVWLEDFGYASLVDGVAVVSIAPDFAGVANLSVKYHVFLTPQGDSQGLYVTT